MSIVLNDGVKTNAPKPSDSRYFSFANELQNRPDIATANATIPSSMRYNGLTINIANEEYWYKDGITDLDLIPKVLGGGSYTADNGLTLTGSNFQLGGQLIEPITIISGNNTDFKIGDISNPITNLYISSNALFLSNDISNITLSIQDGYGIEAISDNIYYYSGGQQRMFMENGVGMKFEYTTTGKLNIDATELKISTVGKDLNLEVGAGGTFNLTAVGAGGGLHYNNGNTLIFDGGNINFSTSGSAVNTIGNIGQDFALNVQTFAINGNLPTGANQALIWDGSIYTWGSPLSSLTFDNGLTETLGNVQLGGALTQNTAITGAFDIAFGIPTQEIANFNVKGTGNIDMTTDGVVGIGAGSGFVSFSSNDGGFYFSSYGTGGDFIVETNTGADTSFLTRKSILKGWNVTSPKWEQVYEINTVNATPTTTTLFMTQTDSTYLVELSINATRTGGSAGTAGDYATYKRIFRVKNLGGTVTLGTIIDVYTDEDQTSWDVTAIVSGLNIQAQVTGATNNNIRWSIETNVVEGTFTP